MIIVFTTVLAFASLYLPQPILPVLAQQFHVTQPDAALLTAVTMAPLGVAPILYGFLADRISARRLLRSAVGLLAVSELLLALAGSFWMLLLLRFAQGLVLPAVFTSLVTYSANTAGTGRVRHAVNLYIGSSIIGGFSGRLLGGFITEHFHWRVAFALVGILLVAVWLVLPQLQSDARGEVAPIGLQAVREVLAQAVYRNAYLGIFVVFFVFASILNYLPFRLTALHPTISESTISLVYLGYLSGALIALNGVRIATWIGGELRGIFAGVALLAVGIFGMAMTTLLSSFVSVFFMCAGFFLVHSLLTAFLNHVATSSKGVINGLYISFYYAGGALGGWLPGYLYRSAGWNFYLAFLASLLAVAALWLWRMTVASERLQAS